MFFQGLLSPRYPDSVFIILDSENGIPVPVATCFVVAPTFLLSCLHFAVPNKSEYIIATTVEKRNSQYTISGPHYAVRIRYYNTNNDYCILELLDTSVALSPIPISIQELEPETDLKVYHAPVDAFNDHSSNVLSIFTAWVRCARPSLHHIYCQGSLYGGSSGAPFILRNGRVVGFHQESLNAAKSVDLDIMKNMSAQEVIELVSETVNSNTTVYGSISSGLYIAKCRILVQTLVKIGADIE